MSAKWYSYTRSMQDKGGNEVIIFHAIFANSVAYEIKKDSMGLFEDVFVDIIKGRFVARLMDVQNSKVQEKHITNTNLVGDPDSIKNLKEYTALGLDMYIKQDIKDAVFNDLIAFHLEGPSLNMELGMKPMSHQKAINSFQGVVNTCTENGRNDSFIDVRQFQKTGSVVFETQSLGCDQSRVGTLILAIEDIQNETVNFQCDDDIYKDYIKYLSDLHKISRLENIEIFVLGRPYIIENSHYLSVVNSAIFRKQVNKTGIIKYINKESDYFKLQTEDGEFSIRYGDYEFKDSLLKQLKSIEANEQEVEIRGLATKKKTVIFYDFV